MKFILHIKKGIYPKLVLIVLVAVLLLGIFLLDEKKNIFSDVSAEESVQVPILMYHSILKDSKFQGEFVLSPGDFENDLIYLKKRGYETVVINDLINYVYNGGTLPQKPIMLTFDDGYGNNYFYVYPLLKKYNCKIVLSPIVKLTEEYSEVNDTRINYSHVTWDNIREMMESGLVEIQNHSYNMHDRKYRIGTKNKLCESREQYEKVLTEDVGKAQSRIYEETGYAPTAFVYPFGAVGKDSLDILKSMGFKATLICENKMNIITRDPECLYGLFRFKRPGKISTCQYFMDKKL